MFLDSFLFICNHKCLMKKGFVELCSQGPEVLVQRKKIHSEDIPLTK